MNTNVRPGEGAAAATHANSLIVYGRGSDKKPHAALFPAADTDAARTAATAAKLTFVEAAAHELKKFSAELPAGKLLADGTATVPVVTQALYDRLLKTIASSAIEATAYGMTLTRPRKWSEIGVGSLVVADEGLEAGWWPAVVLEIKDDQLVLRWRDYPKQASVTRPRDEVALLFTSEA